jgi:ubiquitin carboxyl-terminal hydrolase 5/13
MDHCMNESNKLPPLSCCSISHIGKNTGSGHYVCHVKRDGKWIIFNDEKVALSENPPIPHAYLYLFQRSDTIGSPHPGY